MKLLQHYVSEKDYGCGSLLVFDDRWTIVDLEYDGYIDIFLYNTEPELLKELMDVFAFALAKDQANIKYDEKYELCAQEYKFTIVVDKDNIKFAINSELKLIFYRIIEYGDLDNFFSDVTEILTSEGIL